MAIDEIIDGRLKRFQISSFGPCGEVFDMRGPAEVFVHVPHPGSHPHEIQSGTAATFDEARAEFASAWAVLLANRTEADFQAWRHDRDWTKKKYAMWKRGELLPSQKPDTMMRCPCGITFDSHDPAGIYVHRQHIYAKQTALG